MAYNRRGPMLKSNNNVVEESRDGYLKDELIKVYKDRIHDLEEKLEAMKSRNPLSKETHK